MTYVSEEYKHWKQQMRVFLKIAFTIIGLMMLFGLTRNCETRDSARERLNIYAWGVSEYDPAEGWAERDEAITDSGVIVLNPVKFLGLLEISYHEDHSCVSSSAFGLFFMNMYLWMIVIFTLYSSIRGVIKRVKRRKAHIAS